MSGLPAALGGLVVTGAACTAGPDIVSRPAPAPQPIVDTSPYVCELIPEQALRLVSGMTGSIAGRMAGTEENGECWAPETASRPLQVNWLAANSRASQEQLNFLMEDRSSVYARHGGIRLPTDLGDGMAAKVTQGPLGDQPYRVSAKFRCGGKERMIDIYLTRVAEGRDGIKDLVELMRVAQKRYGEVYRCTPGS
ncbi:hypothetical protein E1286_10585 [Nonomuraea terrae]|uniref:DUF3558 domain-containing protein n=1 Tax=Nonomuraea terrae TaxID=2530383 RepID=A0A4R4Z099_9ACTN|nr:hypothetical protein [Nonomuraea terrae]TDD51301.1 hypothetical protein E1286_10585 [Nonomuraea terrae]